MQHHVSMICPSRQRPADFKRTITSAIEPAKPLDRLEFLIYVDNDDPTVDEYWAIIRELRAQHGHKLDLNMICGEPIGVINCVNHLAFNSTGTVIMPFSDDHVFRTQGWDMLLDVAVDKFPDQIYCAWFNDNWESERWATSPIVSRKWIETLGYYLVPLFEVYYVDTWVWLLGQKLQRSAYIRDGLVEHLHWKNKRREVDDTDLSRGEDAGVKVQRRDQERLQKFQRYLDLDARLLASVMQRAGAQQNAQPTAQQNAQGGAQDSAPRVRRDDEIVFGE